MLYYKFIFKISSSPAKCICMNIISKDKPNGSVYSIDMLFTETIKIADVFICNFNSKYFS